MRASVQDLERVTVPPGMEVERVTHEDDLIYFKDAAKAVDNAWGSGWRCGLVVGGVLAGSLGFAVGGLLVSAGWFG